MSTGDKKRTSDKDEGRRPRRRARGHRRVGNVSPGAVSGRSADLSSRRFRERSEDQVRWDPVDGVHYVSTGGKATAAPPRREARPRRAARSAGQPQAEEPPEDGQVPYDDGDAEALEGEYEEPYDEAYEGSRELRVRPSARDRAVGAIATLRSLPGRFVAWVGRHRKLSIAVVAMVVVVLFVYGPIQRYYVAWRTEGDMQAEYDHLNADNDALKSDLDRLQSKEGIEDEARRRGYTYDGEESATAQGVSDDANQGSTTGDDFSAADIEQPWYIHVLDFVFAYKGVS